MNPSLPLSYQPFLYPPNYELARVHKNCSMPGINVQNGQQCPCCDKQQKEPFKQWLPRSIQKDFSRYGGSVVSYFWLLKLYIGVIGIVLVLYSIYLSYVIQQYCSQKDDCNKILGIWIVSNDTLIKILTRYEEKQTKLRLLTLRGIAFVILMLTNALSLILVKRFKQQHPTKISISDYSVIFKNTSLTQEEMILKLKKQFPSVQIKEILKIQEIEPFYTLYRQKVQQYYQLLNVDDKKVKEAQKLKMVEKLRKINALSKQSEQKFYSKKGQRIIITFETIDMKQQVLSKYHRNYLQKFKNLVNFSDSETQEYCQQAAQPEEIIWHNIGSNDKFKAKYKLLSIVYFFGLLGLCYLILFLCMHMVYNQSFPQPYNTIIINVILFFLVYVALTFRQFMNRFSELSHPSTFTHRTLFIVLTTISFHLLFYLIIPTVYFSGADSQSHRNEILKMISNQVLNFILFQFIIVGVDLMYCCWNRRLKQVEDQSKPIACQFLLHQYMQYPRFPIQFKLIILFKLWSFTMFFSFQSPFVLVLIFFVLIFLFFKDKHSIYCHYRMQIIDNKVQFKFLKIYTTFFSVYAFLIFVLTQHLEIEFWLAAGFTLVMILIQLFWIGKDFQTKKTRFQNQQGTLLLPPSFDELDNKESYRKEYLKFVSRIQNDATDIKINEFLNEKKSLVTEQLIV